MQLFFNHVLGKVTDCDFYYSPVEAEFEPFELTYAVNNGWLINEWSENKRWFQSRAVRIDVQKWVAQMKETKLKIRLPITYSITPLADYPEKLRDDFARVFEAYVTHKKFDAPLNWENMLDNESGSKKLISFFKEGKMIAWTVLRPYGSTTLCSLQFAWDYAEPSLQLGKVSQHLELQLAAHDGYKYLNLCSGYEQSCKWKADIAGFQWWTGKRWSSDAGAYKALCDSDTQAITIDDCITAEGLFHALTA